jgi:hypothetical protein
MGALLVGSGGLDVSTGGRLATTDGTGVATEGPPGSVEVILAVPVEVAEDGASNVCSSTVTLALAAAEDVPEAKPFTSDAVGAAGAFVSTSAGRT